MRRLGPEEDPPGLLRGAPSARERRLHFVLRDPSRAPVVEVLGSRFLPLFGRDDEACADVSWKLRFPRVVRVHPAAGAAGTVPDTLQTFWRKGCEAGLAQRGTSWLEILMRLHRAGELSGAAGRSPAERTAEWRRPVPSARGWVARRASAGRWLTSRAAAWGPAALAAVRSPVSTES